MKATLFSIALLALSLTAYAQESTEDLDAKYGAELLKPGTPAPDFTLRHCLDNATKFNFKQDGMGGYVVLDFWASWCSDCRREMPTVRAMSEKYFDKEVSFIGISYDTDSVQWKKCVTERYKLVGIQLSELKKWKETQTSKDYHIKWLPTMYLINPDGTVNLATVDSRKMERRLAELDSIGALEKYKLSLPQFPGGVGSLVQFLQSNVKYPKACQKVGIEARVLVSFIVAEDGELQEIKVKEYKQLGQCASCKITSLELLKQKEQECRGLFEQEALRVTAKMPHWEPAHRNGKKVRVRFTVPFVFRLR